VKQKTPVQLLKEFLGRHLFGDEGYELSSENERLLREAIAICSHKNSRKRWIMLTSRGKICEGVLYQSKRYTQEQADYLNQQPNLNYRIVKATILWNRRTK